MYKGHSITAIIPCLNEEKAIGHVLRDIPEFVDEVIVVDNNSTDRTPEVAREFSAKVVHEPVAGYGRAYKRGFSVATGDIIVTLDGDHTYPVSGISYLLEAFLHLQVDFLNASRFPIRDRDGMSFKHKIGNIILSTAMSLLYFKWVRDSQSGMWVFRRSLLEEMQLRVGRNGVLRRDQDRGATVPGSALWRDLDSVQHATRRDQTEPLPRRPVQPLVSGTKKVWQSKAVRRT